MKKRLTKQEYCRHSLARLLLVRDRLQETMNDIFDLDYGIPTDDIVLPMRKAEVALDEAIKKEMRERCNDEEMGK